MCTATISEPISDDKAYQVRFRAALPLLAQLGRYLSWNQCFLSHSFPCETYSRRRGSRRYFNTEKWLTSPLFHRTCAKSRAAPLNLNVMRLITHESNV